MAGRRILLVMEDAFLARTMERLLYELGHEVCGMVRGLEALAKARELGPDLALVDLDLTRGTDTVALTEDLHALQIPVLCLFDLEEVDLAQDIQVRIPSLCLLKPFNLAHLRLAVASLLEWHDAERQLRESETRLRLLVDSACDWEYWLGPDGRFLYVSPSCQRITGYSAEAFLQDPELAWRIVHPEDREMVMTHKEKAQTIPGPVAIQFRLQRRDGRVRWIEHLCQAIYEPDGTYLGRHATNRDITERKLAMRPKPWRRCVSWRTYSSFRRA